MANNRINYSIGFDVEQSGLNKAKAALQELQRLTASDLAKINFTGLDQAEQDLKKLKASAAELESAFNKAFNQDLGTINVTKFNQQLQKLDLNKIYKDFSLAGEAGKAAFRNTATEALTANMKLKQTHKVLDDIANTMKNTAKWGIASSVMNSFTNSVQQAYGYVKHLDSSLNDIRIVTGYSADEMDRFAEKANKAAKNLAASTTDYTEAALIYYQQGLSGEEVEKRAETTLKAANVTGQDAAAVSEQLTAVWNGYKVSAQETEVYVDKLAAVAATTASDLEELSKGMEKVASAAEASGVDIDQLSATLSTVISVTRQAPESVGTAFKTIYARLGDLAVDGEDEFGTKLGEVSSKLKTMGIEILDSQGQMRDMGTVVEEVAEKWDTWSQAQKQAAAVAMAGKRQYNNLIALFENWDMYESSLQTSQNSLGTLSEQQEIYLDSAEAKLQQLKTAQEGLYDSLLDADTIKEVAGLLTGLFSGLENFVDTIGGGSTVLLGFGAILTKVFNKQLAQGLNTAVFNFKAMKDNMTQVKATGQSLETLVAWANNVDNEVDDATKSVINLKNELFKVSGVLSDEEYNEINGLVQKYNEAATAVEKFRTEKEKASSVASRVTGGSIGDETFTAIDAERKKLLSQDKDASSQDLNKRNETLQKTKATLENIYKEQEKNKKSAQAYTSALAKAQKIKIEGTWEESSKEAKKLLNIQDQMIKKAAELNASGKLKGTDSQRELNDLLVTYNALNKAGEDTEHIAQKIAAAMEKASSEIQADIRESGMVFEQVAEGMEADASEAANSIRQKLNGAINTLGDAKKMQGFTTTLGNVEMALFGITAAASAFKSAMDEDLSAGERLMAVMTGLVTSATMILPLVSQLAAAYKSGSLMKGLDTAATVINTGVTKALTVVTGQATTAQLAHNAAVQANPYVAAATALLVLVGAIATFITIVKNSSDTTKQALEDAKEATEAARTEFEEVQTKINDINSALSSWDSAVDTMQDLEEGTAAWKQQLIEANNQILTLLDTYPQLATFIEKDSNGLLSLNNDGYEELEKIQTKELEAAQTKYAIAQGNEANVQKDAVATQLSQDTTIGEFTAGKILDYGYENGNAFLSADKEALTSTYGFGNTEADLIIKYSEEIADALAKGAAYATEAEMHTDTVVDSVMSSLDGYSALTAEEQKNARDRLKDEGWDTTFDTKYAIREGNTDKKNRNDYAKQIGATGWEKNDDGDIEYTMADGSTQIIEDSVAILELATQDTADALGDVATSAIEAAKKMSEVKNDLLMDNNSQSGQRKEMSENEANAIAGASKEDGLDGSNISDVELDNLLMGTGGKTGNDYHLTKDAALNAGFTEEDAAAAGYTGENALVEYFQAWLNEQAHELKAQREEEKNNKIDQLVSDEEGGLNSAANQVTYGAAVNKQDFETAGFTNDDVQNWDAISEHLDQSTIATEGWATALKQAKEEYTKVTETQAEVDQALAEAEAEGFDTEVIKQHAEALMENNEAFKDNEALATKAAVAQQKQQRGMEKLTDGWEDYSDVLKDAEASEAEIAEASVEVMDSLADIYDLTDEELEMLPPNFAKDNLDLIEDVKNGVEGAYEELLAKLGEEAIIGLKLDPNTTQDLTEAVNGITSAIDTQDLQIGASLDDTGYTDTLNTMLANGQMTAADITTALEAIQFSPEITYKEVPANTLSKEWLNQKAEIINPETGEIETVTLTSDHLTQEDVMVRIPTINGANTKYTGGGAPKSTSSNKSSGGGGGGSTPSKTHKKSDKKLDRYRTVNNELTKLTTTLDRLTEAQDRLYGKDLLDNLNAQLKVIKQQVVQTKKKLDLAKDEAEEMRTAAKTNETDENGYQVKNTLADFGIKFNDDGEITNYATKMNWYDDKIAELEKEWNNMSAEEQEDNESLSNRIEALKTNRDTLEELVADYDELIYEKIPELQDEITEAAYTQIEIKLKAFKVEAELYLDMSEALSDLKDFKDQLIDAMSYSDLKYNGKDDAAYNETNARAQQNKLTAAAAMEALTGDKYGKYGNRVTTSNKKGEWAVSDEKNTAYLLKHDKDDKVSNDNNAVARNAAALQKMNNAYAAYTADPEKFLNDPANKKWTATDANGNKVFNEDKFREEMQNTRDDLEAEIEKVDQMFEDVRTSLLDTIELMGESYDQQLETFDFINSQIERKLDAAKLLNGESDYEGLKTAYAEAAENAAKKEATAKEAMNLYESKMNSAATEEEREKWRELYQKSVEDYQDANAAAIEALQAQRENTIRAQAEQMFGSEADFSKAEAEWEIQQNLNDKYLDDVDKAYEIQKLTNKLNKDMNDASLAAQSKLAKFREDELKKLKEKDKLTAADVERANKLYDIELKKIALEEAQNNKSQMRLRRDSSGNYSYQFTADENKSADAQQALDDAQYDLREFDLEQERLAQEELLNLKKEYKDKWIEYQLLSEAEQAARAEEWKAYQEYYNAEITQSALTAIETKANATESSYQLSANLYAQDHSTFTTLNDEQKRLLEEKHESFDTMTMEEIGLIRDTMTPTWTESMNSMITDVTGQDGLEIAWSNATDKIATKAYDTEGKLQTDWKTAMDMIINGNVGEGGIVTEWTTQTGEIQTSLSTAADGMSGAWKNTMQGIAAGNEAEDGIVSAWSGQTVTMKDSWETQLGLMAGQYDHEKKNTFAYKVKDGNDKIITDVGAINTKINGLATSMDTTATKAADYAKNTWLPELQKVTTETGDILEDLEDMQDALLDQKPYWDKLKGWASGVADKTSQILADTAAIEAASTTTTTKKKSSTTTTKRTSTTKNTSTQGNNKLNAGDKVTINSSYATSAGGKYISNPKYGKGSSLYVQDVPGHGVSVTKSGTVWVHVGTSKSYSAGSAVGWIKKKDISGYDTGGYTGEWTGNEGRMAFLHSKELVLNKTDTQNILNAVELVRDLQESQSVGFAGALEKIFETVLSAMDDRFDKILKQEREHQNKLISNHNNSNNIQQTITIQADFPNAENVKAIEEALNTLVNQATQRAYSTLK